MPLGVLEGVSKDKKDNVGMVWMTAPSPPPPPPCHGMGVGGGGGGKQGTVDRRQSGKVFKS